MMQILMNDEMGVSILSACKKRKVKATTETFEQKNNGSINSIGIGQYPEKKRRRKTSSHGFPRH